jgi:hypothetical protein
LKRCRMDRFGYRFERLKSLVGFAFGDNYSVLKAPA